MASTKLKTTKDGKKYYEIRVRLSREKPTYTSRWYVPNGWSQKKIDRELTKISAEFELRCNNGEVLSRAEKKAIKAEQDRLAEEQKHRAEEQAKLAAIEAAKIQTFKQYGERVFMPSKKITTAEKTREYYQGALNNHLYKAFGAIPLQDLTSAQITEYFTKLQASDLSHSTIIGIYVTLNQLLKMAYNDDTIDRNPIDKVQRPRQRKDEQKRNVEAFTADELTKINQYLEKEPLKWRAMIRLIEDTGIRRGEACGLKWENIDFKNNSALIKWNICYSKEKGTYEGATKTGKEREVYFTQAVADILKAYHAEQIAATKKRTERLKKDGKPLDIEKVAIPEYVFTEKGINAPMHPDSPNVYLREFSKRYGIKIHPHKLRHSFASVAITKGADVASVSEILGHAQISTTLNMYTHANEESKRKAAAIVHSAIAQA